MWSTVGGREAAVIGRDLWERWLGAALEGISFLPWAVVARH